MSISTLAAYVAALLLAGMMVFQALLALGLPLGHLAWGGRHPGVLPKKLRVSSLFAIFILAAAGWVVLARAGIAPPGPDVWIVRIMVWAFGAYFALNTAGNLASESVMEKRIMTPVSALLVITFVAVALS